MENDSTSPYMYSSEISAMINTHSKALRASTLMSAIIEDIIHTELVKLVVHSIFIGQYQAQHCFNHNCQSIFHPYIDASDLGIDTAIPRYAALSIETILMAIRHDRIKYNRVIEYIAWKEVRKSAAKQQVELSDNLIYDLSSNEEVEEFSSVPLGQSYAFKSASWSFLNQLLSCCQDEKSRPIVKEFLAAQGSLGADPTSAREVQERLKNADRETMEMSKEQYLTWTEYRQASFTYKKGRKFREWLTNRYSSTDVFLNHHPLTEKSTWIKNIRMNDDVVEAMGFIAFEIVHQLVSSSLRVFAPHDPSQLEAHHVLQFYKKSLKTKFNLWS